MKREIVRINDEKCNGCGVCIPNCHEGALQIIDNKAVLVSELMCDGLGACLGHCPEGALTIESREAEQYDESKVMREMVSKGKNVVIAHLKHLKDHNEQGLLKQGIRYLWDNKDMLTFNPAEVVEEVHGLKPFSAEFSVAGKTHATSVHSPHSCPGSKSMNIVRHEMKADTTSCPGSKSMHIERHERKAEATGIEIMEEQSSALTHWPVQLHLINPAAGYFEGSDLLLSADCVAFSMGNFHSKYLKNKKLIIACPKLDRGMEVYVEKIRRLIDEAKVNTITVMRMEVPCCGGLLQMVKTALNDAINKVPVKEIVVSVEGGVVKEGWV
jgi:NAD-dependent dihydropyrimidine dehydrogenase PreA subunit